ncbi:hypothetical protein ACFQY4_41605 [Catellatospora bangladeshensis]|uniref:hypothetical protein n=1 Tax=Catellatospora bangladeshensis TaxID=310355 RepID=UPI00360A7554
MRGLVAPGRLVTAGLRVARRLRVTRGCGRLRTGRRRLAGGLRQLRGGGLGRGLRQLRGGGSAGVCGCGQVAAVASGSTGRLGSAAA